MKDKMVVMSRNDYEHLLERSRRYENILKAQSDLIQKAGDLEQENASLKKRQVSFMPKDIVFDNPEILVQWEDESMTLMKCEPGDTFSKEAGVALAICKKIMGGKEFRRFFDSIELHPLAEQCQTKGE